MPRMLMPACFCSFLCVALVGCGSTEADCQAACERTKQQCSRTTDCKAMCTEMSDRATASGCETKLAALTSCADDADDVCDSSTCDAENKAFYACFEAYCDKDGDPVLCK